MTPMAELIIHALARGCSDLSFGSSFVASFNKLFVKVNSLESIVELEYKDAGTWKSTRISKGNTNLQHLLDMIIIHWMVPLNESSTISFIKQFRVTQLKIDNVHLEAIIMIFQSIAQVKWMIRFTKYQMRLKFIFIKFHIKYNSIYKTQLDGLTGLGFFGGGPTTKHDKSQNNIFNCT